jgi:hypothetical protein
MGKERAMKKLMLIFAAVCLLTAGAVFAQVNNTEDPEYYPGTQIIDFVKSVPIIGEIVKPTNSYFHTKRQVDFDILIPVRDNFLPEMMKTVSSL